LQACSNPLDFNDDGKQVKEKNDRQTYLQEFNDYLNDQNCMSTVIIPHLDLVINMIEKNIFRPLPVLKKQGLPGEGIGMEEVLRPLFRNKLWPIQHGSTFSQSMNSSCS
jgi:serine/threonine-protein phosphatase 2A regulatory subunit B'